MSNLFLPETEGERGGRTVTIDVLKPEITDIDEKHNTITIEGLGVGTDESNRDSGTVITIELLGNQLRIPRNLYNIRITFEED